MLSPMPRLDEIHRHIDAAGGDDPRQALIAVRKLIGDDVPWLERYAVDLARRELWSWVRISRLLMRSRQAVRERFKRFDGEPLPNDEVNDPIAELDAAAEIMLQRFRKAQAARLEREQGLEETDTLDGDSSGLRTIQ
jgi:hypothetical protein